MKKIILMTCISALSFTYSINAQAKIYKWTDAKGVVHYSAKPPTTSIKANKAAKNIESDIRLSAGKHRVAKKEQQQDENTSEETNSESESELSAAPKKLVDYCKSQKTNLTNLKNNFRNVWVDTAGKKTVLDQKQRQEKVDYLKGRIKKDCQEVETK